MATNNPFHNQSILVTGASGFIGMALTQQLIELGAEVTGTYRRCMPETCRVNWKQVELTDAKQVSNLFEQTSPSVVFHLAGSTHGERDTAAVTPTFENNLVATVNLLTAASQATTDPYVILAGSMEEPDPDGKYPIPSSPYAASKFAATSYARAFHAFQNLSVVIARIFMVYGPGQKDSNKLLPYVIASALNDRAPELTSGLRRIDWIYIDDLVKGLVEIGKSAKLSGSTVELGSGSLHSIREIVELTIAKLDSKILPAFGAKPDRPLEQERRANVQQTHEQLGWQPKTPLDHGLEKTIDWMKAQLERDN